MKAEAWQKKREYTEVELDLALEILNDLKDGVVLNVAQRAHPKPDGEGFIPKHALVTVYRQMVESGDWEEDEALLRVIRMKPIRTLSGVTTVHGADQVSSLPGKLYFLPSGGPAPQELSQRRTGSQAGCGEQL